MNYRLLIADDHEVIRTGLATVMEGTEFEVEATARSGPEAVQLARELKPDLVVMDLRMPEGSGLSALAEMRRELPEVRVLILSNYDNPAYINQAATLGADGYLLKDSPRNRLLDSMRSIVHGEQVWESDVVRRGSVYETKSSGDLEVPLTRRETEVLCKLAGGLANKEIARLLHISVETVKEHVHNILGKLNASGRTQAAVWAVRHGLV